MQKKKKTVTYYQLRLDKFDRFFAQSCRDFLNFHTFLQRSMYTKKDIQFRLEYKNSWLSHKSQL